jgi:hypothetical protein
MGMTLRLSVRRWLAGALFVASASAQAQQEVGSGGDPVQLMFGKARVDALSVLAAFAAHAGEADLPSHFTPPVLDQLLRTIDGAPVYLAMYPDLHDALHKFFDPEIEPIVQSTCARTSLPDEPPSLIRFSLPKCRLALTDGGEEIAVVTLLHETSHHFGLDDSPASEQLAWDVGNQLHAYWQLLRDRTKPHWVPTTLDRAPSARAQHSTTVLTAGDEMSQVLVWGGCNYAALPDRESCERYLDSGAILTVTGQGDDLETTWEELPVPAGVEGRKLHTAAYTGVSAPAGIAGHRPGKVLIWGGCNGPDASCSQFPANGGLYDVATGEWSVLAPPDGVRGRIYHTGVWTDDGLLILGGLGAGRQVLGDAYRVRVPASGAPEWVREPVPEALAARYGHSTAVSSDGVFIWGGCARRGSVICLEYRNDGLAYVGGRWITLQAPAWLQARAFHAAAIVGKQMLIWGGSDGLQTVLSDGAILDFSAADPAAWTWVPIPANLPRGETGRSLYGLSATTGGVIVFGGEAGRRELRQTALTLDWLSGAPSQQSWRVVETDTDPIARKDHSQALLPQGLLVWGGYGADETYLPTGAVLTQLP